MILLFFNLWLSNLWRENYEKPFSGMYSNIIKSMGLFYKHFECSTYFDNFRMQLKAKALWTIFFIFISLLLVLADFPTFIINIPFIIQVLRTISAIEYQRKRKIIYNNEMPYDTKKIAYPILKANSIVIVYQATMSIITFIITTIFVFNLM